MAAILPFKAIKPNPLYADQLVFAEGRMVAKPGDAAKDEPMPTLKAMLESTARIRPETPERQMMAYNEIDAKFQQLLDTGQLYREQKPGIYVYEIVHPKYRQTGIWCLTALSDYTSGKIKTHELTFTDSVRRMRNYREHTGLEGSPVLLTYTPSIAINRIIAKTRKTVAKNTLGDRSCFHRIWKIEDEPTKRILTKAFAAISMVYLADGHHRLASAAKLRAKQIEEGKPVFDYISSLYIATDQLSIKEFNRVVLPEKPVNMIKLFRDLAKDFTIRKKVGNHSFQSRRQHLMGMYCQGNWYYLEPKAIPPNGIAAGLDASILQKQLLAPLFEINDPATDTRLKYIGGESALEELVDMLKIHPEAIAFTLCPLTNQQLMDVSDANEILPPKSTWINPKVPYGLLMHKHLVS